MRGFPHTLKTKKDIENVLSLVSKGKLPKEDLLKVLRSILNTDQHYVFDKILNSPDEKDGEEPQYRVLEQEKEDGSKECVQFKLVENPNAIFRVMGYTKDEINNLITYVEQL